MLTEAVRIPPGAIYEREGTVSWRKWANEGSDTCLQLGDESAFGLEKHCAVIRANVDMTRESTILSLHDSIEMRKAMKSMH